MEDLAGPGRAVVDWYYDPLPTNCVADWVCAEGSGRRPHGAGRKNLAVFFGGCSFHCAFCQNVSHWALARAGAPRHSVPELVQAVDGKTACLCYFGGDPTPQIAFSLQAAEEAFREHSQLRLCWETNGSMTPALADRMFELALRSGGCVKFDLKARTDSLHRALTSASNQLTLRNFRRLASRISERPDPPPLVASTLLVPGYVGAEEVGVIASLLAELDPALPYSLLGFAPHYLLSDLPTTSRAQASACLMAAREAGLTRVRLGNVHLLS